MGSKTCALLCVFDGHGERGDMIRRVLRAYEVFCPLHPSLEVFQALLVFVEPREGTDFQSNIPSRWDYST